MESTQHRHPAHQIIADQLSAHPDSDRAADADRDAEYILEALGRAGYIVLLVKRDE